MSSKKQQGFTAQDYIAIFNRPRKTFNDVIARLQTSKAEHEAALYEEGRRLGCEWAAWQTTYQSLSELVGFIDKDEPRIGPKTAERIRDWAKHDGVELPCDYAQNFELPARGFHAGATEVWERALPHLLPKPPHPSLTRWSRAALSTAARTLAPASSAHV